MRYFEVNLKEASVPSNLLAPRYFHGTKKQHIKNVLAHGLYPPDFVAFGRRNTALRPVQGRVYLTPNACQASGYGQYLLVINRESLIGDLQPDEDEVGEIFHWIMQKDFPNLDKTREIHKGNDDFIARMEYLNQPDQAKPVRKFKDFMRNTLTPNMQNQVIGGEYDWWAKSGKAALKKMPDNIMLWLISLGVHVGYEGRLLPDEAWLINKKGLLSDGSNLSQVATQLYYNKAATTPMPPKGPPQKFNVTIQWNINWSTKLKEPKYKTRIVTFTAPSEEEARAEAESYVERTVPTAEYKIVGFEKADQPLKDLRLSNSDR